MNSSPTPPSPQSSSELTIAAVFFGLLLSVIMGAANVYLGLKVGMTVSASIPAAVLGMGLFRLLRGQGSILESNLVQTAASAGESLAAGIIFTMPALVITGQWASFNGPKQYLVITAVAMAGGLLGILFMVPMRKVFVVEDKNLPYPEGIACSEVLKSGESAGRGAQVVLAGLGLGVVLKFAISSLNLIAGKLTWATFAGTRVFPVGTDVSPALLGVGYIVGLPIAVQIFLGGAIGWFVGIPLLGGFEGGNAAAAFGHAETLWSTKIRYMGVGAMVVGGLVTIFRVRHGMASAVKELHRQFKSRRTAQESHTVPDTERNLSGGVLLATSIVSIGVIGALYFYLTGHPVISVLTLVAMVVLSFFFTAVASYIVGLVGNSNSPVSGMTITAVLATAGLIALFGFSGSTAIVATLGVAGVVCCVACTAGDVCNDLKTGHIVGASPRRQQVLQIAGVFVAAFVMCPVLHVLHEGNKDSGGIGGKDLSAPQATLFANLTRGFFETAGPAEEPANQGADDEPEGEADAAPGESTPKKGIDLPKDMLLYGVLVGVALLIADALLGVALGPNRTFHLYIMPVAVGIYLPVELSVPILAGGVLHFLSGRLAGQEKRTDALKLGVLLASGLIAGEALTGVFAAFLKYLEVDLAIELPQTVQKIGGAATLAFVGFVLLLPALARRSGGSVSE